MVIIYSFLCAFLPCFIYLLIKNRKEKKFYIVFIVLFIIYLWMVYNVTGAGGLSDIIYAPRGGINDSIIKANINLKFLENGINTTFLLNILMCVPLGFLLPLIWKKYRNILKTTLFGFCFSLLIELSQLITTRATDIDDLVANTFGTIIGYIIWIIFSKIFFKNKEGIRGIKEPIIYVLISYFGMFFLYFPFWFAFNIEPLLQ